MFTYKNKTSDEMHLKIEGRLAFPSPERDIEFVEVPGRSGDIPFDNNRYRSVIREIPCRLLLPEESNLNIEQASTNIANWLKTDMNFHPFLWSGDPEFTYYVMSNQQYNTERMISRYGRCVFYFRFHPIKFLTESLIEQKITSGTKIHIPYNIPSEPIIRVVGSGDITIRIGNQDLVLQGVDHGITIDVENESATTYDGLRPAFDKVYTYPFPKLYPGDNTITFGSGVEVYITPRIGALIG